MTELQQGAFQGDDQGQEFAWRYHIPRVVISEYRENHTSRVRGNTGTVGDVDKAATI